MRGSNGGTERVVGRAGHTSRLLSESIIADVRSNIAWIESRQEGVASINAASRHRFYRNQSRPREDGCHSSGLRHRIASLFGKV